MKQGVAWPSFSLEKNEDFKMKLILLPPVKLKSGPAADGEESEGEVFCFEDTDTEESSTSDGSMPVVAKVSQSTNS